MFSQNNRCFAVNCMSEPTASQNSNCKTLNERQIHGLEDSNGPRDRFTTFRPNKIGTGQNWHRKKNEPTLLYSALIKKYSYAKLILLRSMATRYIGNMIAFLRCNFAYLSITITSKLSALNHNKILYYCNCHATISSSVHTFASFFRKL